MSPEYKDNTMKGKSAIYYLNRAINASGTCTTKPALGPKKQGHLHTDYRYIYS